MPKAIAYLCEDTQTHVYIKASTALLHSWNMAPLLSFLECVFCIQFTTITGSQYAIVEGRLVIFLSLSPYVPVVSEVAELACVDCGDATHGH